MQQPRCSLCLIFICVLAFLAGRTASAQAKDYFVYFGTYTGFRFVRHSKTQGVGESHSKGIYVSRFNAATGTLSEPESLPPKLSIRPSSRFLRIIASSTPSPRIRFRWGRRSIMSHT